MARIQCRSKSQRLDKTYFVIIIDTRGVVFITVQGTQSFVPWHVSDIRRLSWPRPITLEPCQLEGLASKWKQFRDIYAAA